ncbi:MAG: 5'-nucleotidase C-terminal domain-containing protein [Calditrichaceae bacterium]|nr:5'-nucleotidase C-terminal domain-containing protein [Calditrichaceae bacterium]
MKSIYIFIILTISFLSAQTIDTLYILQTTDIHGRIYPYDYYQDKPADYGLAKIYSKVVEFRKAHQNVLLLDGGDMIQGTPMNYYFNKIESSLPNPMILTMNYMGYDAMAVGNHDIEQGLFVYNKAQRESNFSWLSANSTLPDLSTYFEPYTIYEINGIRIGIIGLTTPGIPMWLDPLLYPGITWEDMIETAAFYADEIRDDVDVLIGLFHAGFNEEYSDETTESLGLPNENASMLVADQVPGFDVILAGHSHREVAIRKFENNQWLIEDKYLNHDKAEKNNTLLMNAGSWGRNLGVAQIILHQDKRQKTKDKNNNGQIQVYENESDHSRFEIIEKNSWLVSMKDVEPSAAILQLNDYYHKKTLEYIRTKIAVTSNELTLKNARFEDNALIELINRAQMDFTGAEISFAAAFNDQLIIPAGPIQIKDVYSIYPYENFLYLIELTGQQIRDFLEYSARYYLTDDGKITANPEVKGYNYDMAEGIKYNIEVRSQKIEDRKNIITDLVLISTGKALELDKTYKVAMNSYRATGGGGHMAAAKATDTNILLKSNEDMRTILVNYLRKQGKISAKVDGNWEILKKNDK